MTVPGTASGAACHAGARNNGPASDLHGFRRGGVPPSESPSERRGAGAAQAEARLIGFAAGLVRAYLKIAS